MKKKMLIVMMNLYNGGAEKSLVNMLNEINPNKYEIDLLLFQKKGLFLKQVPAYVNIIEEPIDLYLLYNKPTIKNMLNVKNIKFIISRILYSIVVKIKYKKYNPRIRRQIRWNMYYKKLIKPLNNKYDISISYLENEPMRYVIDKTYATKKYIWIHSNYKKMEYLKEYDFEYFNKSDKIITISEECVNVLKKEFLNEKEKIEYLPNLSSKKTIEMLAKERPIIEFDKNKFKIVSIGRLSYEKGFDIAVEAAKILKEKNINYQWYIIGDGTMKKEIDKKIKQYKLEKYFYLIGITDNPYSYIESSDILVQPSRSEGKSMVLDEAKILNKPFVVTKYPTIYDQANEDIAVLVDINAEAIAEGIIDIYNNKNKLNVLKQNMKKESYSNEKEILKYYKLFDS